MPWNKDGTRKKSTLYKKQKFGTAKSPFVMKSAFKQWDGTGMTARPFNSAATLGVGMTVRPGASVRTRKAQF